MLEEHLGYVADRLRLEQFRAAVRRTCNSGVQVADLGCGSGILGLLCLQAGAARVFAIEATPMIGVAKETLERAGLGEKCVFVPGDSRRISLPEPVDVVICDHVGYFGFDYGIVHTLQDARRRFLKPGGSLIPSRIRLQLGAVESAQCRDRAESWRGKAVPAEFHWLHCFSVNAIHAVELTGDALLSSPAALGEIDLRTDGADFFTWVAELRMDRDGVMHGLAGWFECELAEGIWMTNSPLASHAIQRPQAFLPIDQSVEVRAGDLVKATIMTRPADNLVSWIVEFAATGQRFSHSTWYGMPLAADFLIRTHPDRVPRVNREGRARVAVLAYCDGRRSAREIEQAVLRDHPDLFPSAAETSLFVSKVLSGDTE